MYYLLAIEITFFFGVSTNPNKKGAGASPALMRFYQSQPLILISPVYHAIDINYLTKTLPRPCIFVNLQKNSPKRGNITNPQRV